MPVYVPTQRVLAMCHPLLTSPWESGQSVTKDLVAKAMENNWFISEPIPSSSHAMAHAARIAFLIKNGWTDSIEIDVGIPSMRCYVDWPVTDGNHRLAAAAYRGDPTILASVGGCLDYAFELFGVECQETQYNFSEVTQ